MFGVDVQWQRNVSFNNSERELTHTELINVPLFGRKHHVFKEQLNVAMCAYVCRDGLLIQ